MVAIRNHTAVWLVRHPQTDWNRQRRYQSRSDRPLTPFGYSIGEAVVRRLRAFPFDVVVSSGLTRTDAIAQDVVAQHRCSHIVNSGWQEVDHGRWEGLTYGEVVQRYGDETFQRWADPWNSRVHGGESMADLWQRIEAAWHALLDTYDGGHIVVVTHGTPIQLLLCASLGVPFERHWQFRVDLGSLTALDLYPSGAILRVVNEAPTLVQKHRKLADE